MTKNWQFAGGDASDAINNVGLAVLIAALTQLYTDFRVRTRFYQDISDHIVANESLRESGILKFFSDSKLCIPHSVLKHCTKIDVGVTYSDRFLKDNLAHICSRGEQLTVRVFYSDMDDPDVLDIVSKNLSISSDAVKSEYTKLKKIIGQIRDSGVNVLEFKNKSMPHYSFYSTDDNCYFLTMSTFASRRASVPLFQVDQSSAIAELIRQDIQHITAST
ncbi:hypothetical protein [Sphingobium sp.]|uniref:hypothetical protein n=1 Tax=Sphingobium sp. TaxID=1912891 RepID=UPI0035C6A989